MNLKQELIKQITILAFKYKISLFVQVFCKDQTFTIILLDMMFISTNRVNLGQLL